MRAGAPRILTGARLCEGDVEPRSMGRLRWLEGAGGWSDASGLRLRVGCWFGTRALTTWARFGVTMRGADKNLTPMSLSLRQSTSQLASKPSSSMSNSKVFGVLMEPSARKWAPVVERL